MTGIAEANKKPTLNNPYGLHAFRSKKLLLDACRIDITKPWFMPNLPIIGTIKIWGRVVEHENGYRAQYAEIVNITKGKALIFEEKKGEIYPPL